MVFYRDTDIETTRDAEQSRDKEEITRDLEDSHDFAQPPPPLYQKQ